MLARVEVTSALLESQMRSPKALTSMIVDGLQAMTRQTRWVTWARTAARGSRPPGPS